MRYPLARVQVWLDTRRPLALGLIRPVPGGRYEPTLTGWVVLHGEAGRG